MFLQEDSCGERRPVAYASQAFTATEKRYAQIEKEALAVTWPCESVRMYMVKLQFNVETNHKPLIPRFSKERLGKLPPQLQRMRMRILKYNFSIAHSPGKELHMADVLPRKLTGQRSSCGTPHLTKYEILTLELLPASAVFLEKPRVELQNDPTTVKAMHEYQSE